MSDPTQFADSQGQQPLEIGDEAWSALVDRLSRRAQQALWWVRRGDASADDAVMSALRTYLRQANQGELPPPTDPDNLWPVLTDQLKRKLDKARLSQHYKKNKMALRFSELPALEDGGPAETSFQDFSEGPDEVEQYVAQALRVLAEAVADEELLRIARMKLECYQTPEIAEATGLTEHQVRRRISKIRTLLSSKQAAE